MAEDVFDMDEALKFFEANGRASIKPRKEPPTTQEKFLAELESQRKNFQKLIDAGKAKDTAKTAWVRWPKPKTDKETGLAKEREEPTAYSISPVPGLVMAHKTLADGTTEPIKFVAAKTPDEALFVLETIKRLAMDTQSELFLNLILQRGTDKEKAEYLPETRKTRRRNNVSYQMASDSDEIMRTPRKRGRKPKVQ